MRSIIRCFALFFAIASFGVAFESCDNSTTSDVGYKGFSQKVDSLLRDTAQQSLYVDSLRIRVLTSENDTDRVRWINELAVYWRGPSGRLMADEGKRISTANGDKYGIADSEMRIAQCLIRDNKYVLADSVIAVAENLATTGKYNYILARLSILKGDVQRFQGNTEAATPNLKAGIALAEERNYLDIVGLGYSSLADVYQLTHNYDSSRYCVNKAIASGVKLNDKSRVALAYVILSVNCRFESKMDSALYFIKKSLSIGKELRDKNRVTSCYSTIGEMYRMQNDDARALVYYDSARVLALSIGNKNQLAYSLGSMGSIYRMQGQSEKALHYYLVALSICREVNNKTLIATNLSTIGDVYRRLKKADTALIYLHEALDVTLSTKDGNRQGFIYVAIAEIYRDSGLYLKALDYLAKADSIASNTSYENLKAITWIEMSHTYLGMGNFGEAVRYGEKAMTASEASQMPTNVQNASKVLYEVYDKQNDKGKALDMYKKYIVARDSVENETQIKKFAQVEYEAKESDLKVKSAEQLAVVSASQARKEEELKNNKIVLVIVAIGFVLLLILAVFIFRNLQETRKARKIIEIQKAEVERQKLLVEGKNKSIGDSISYARRLQNAIIPDEETIHEAFRDFFILYLPKDVVAGDFYWYERTKTHVFLAAADCTGHGVPGALVSVVCSNALNRAVKEYKLTEPGEILDKCKELIIDTFKRSHQLVQDGMDISLLAITCASEVELDLCAQEVKWAGAHNPLWILSDGKMIIIAADKQPVGTWELEKPFATHSISLEKGDQIYLITDGFADQFGGPKGKKLMYKKVQENIISLARLPMAEQGATLQKVFEDWKGDHDQVDDVTLISVRA